MLNAVGLLLYSSFNKQNEADAMSYSIVFNKGH